MKFLLSLFAILLLFAGGFWYILSQNIKNTPATKSTSQFETKQTTVGEQTERITVIAENLDTPWALAFLPDNRMLVTERQGTVRLIDASGTLHSSPLATLPQVKESGEGGLLGIAIHPDFSSNHYVYLYYTYSSTRTGTLNRVVRMTYANERLADEKTIIDAIPGAANHNGGRIKFGPDNMLYVATGDAGEPSEAQNTKSLAGKILCATDEGKTVPDAPFKNLVYSYGHRNIQGLAWDESGKLWATEHGRSGALSGHDEVNLIESGKNYGWPDIQGDETRPNMVSPIKQSGGFTTWAPAGATFLNNSLFFTGLRGRTLYEAVVTEKNIVTIKEYLKEEYGRMRDIVVGPDNMLYIATSNRDGRGTPEENDDRILRVNPQKL